MTTPTPQITWPDDDGVPQHADWRSLAGHPAPHKVVVADDTMSADTAYRLADQGCGLLWRGDYQNAKHLLQALGRRLDARSQQPGKQAGKRKGKDPGKRPETPPDTPPNTPPNTPTNKPTQDLTAAFHAQRLQQAHRARILGQLLLPFNADHSLPLRRAPDVRAAGQQAHGTVGAHYVASLRELMGVVGAFEWRKKGVPVPALGEPIHPHHGVFSPVRGEYVGLVADAPLPAAALTAGAVDVGCGTGVLAAVLARRGLQVVGTDTSATALACAADNLRRLGLQRQVTLQMVDLFPPGQAGLIVCNPPWVPAPAASVLEAAVYDPDSRMLRGYLAGLAAHLAPGGEGWLILSDLAEHLGLRPRTSLLAWISAAGLQVAGRLDTKPMHARAADSSDPLHAARAAETTSLWRLVVA